MNRDEAENPDCRTETEGTAGVREENRNKKSGIKPAAENGIDSGRTVSRGTAVKAEKIGKTKQRFTGKCSGLCRSRNRAAGKSSR